jgi:predicted DNA-binding helix-hairpin-helix protein
MDRQEKLKLLTQAAQYDLCAPCGPTAATESPQIQAMTSRAGEDITRWLYPAALPNGSHVALLKVLQSNRCDNDCFYCGMRRSRDVSRCEFGPDELAKLFDLLARRGLAKGLFLSSAVCDSASRMQEKMLATVELVRRKYHFSGYVHLKLLPGCEPAAVERALLLANRVSVNLEAPNSQRLRSLTADKHFDDDLLAPIRLVSEWSRAHRGHADLTTQFVVGPAGETDREILTTVDYLHRLHDLTRSYFSAFNPIRGTPLENSPATPLMRQNRLYQSDYLLRFYGFQLGDLCFDVNEQLWADTDPKTAWAQKHPEFFPVEVNKVSREELLRVPGIGPRTARRVLEARCESKVRSLEDLHKIGVPTSRCAAYVLVNGFRPPRQLPLL